MATPALAIELIKAFEGFRAKPYLCPAQVWTLGYGSTRDGQGNPVTAATPAVTPSEGEALARRDADRFSAAVLRLLPDVDLSEEERAALVDFTYNLGTGAFQASTLRQCILRGDYAEVPDQLRRWVRGGGRVLPGLVRRREAEAALWAGG